MTLIDGYEVVEELGHGYQADTYKIVYGQQRHHFAVLKQFKVTAHEWSEQLVNEYKALKRLSGFFKPQSIPTVLHQNIKERYIIMEHLPGRLMYVPLNKPKAFTWWFNLAQAVMYAHDRGIYHCDLNPYNVLVEGETVALVDWASSVRVGAKQQPQEGLPRGIWQPPEQPQGQVNRQTDVFSLAAILLWLISGHQPRDPVFQGRDRRSWQVIESVMQEPLGEWPAKDLAKSLEKGTAGDPNLRYSSVKWLHRSIHKWFQRYHK